MKGIYERNPVLRGKDAKRFIDRHNSIKPDPVERDRVMKLYNSFAGRPQANRQLRRSKRPSRIVIEIYDDFTGQSLHRIDWPYEPLKMLDGWYRRLCGRLKNLFTNDPLFKGDLHGKAKTHIEFIYD